MHLVSVIDLFTQNTLQTHTRHEDMTTTITMSRPTDPTDQQKIQTARQTSTVRETQEGEEK